MNFLKIYKDSVKSKNNYYRIVSYKRGYKREWVSGYFSDPRSESEIIREGEYDIETDWQAEDWEAFKLYLAL